MQCSTLLAIISTLIPLLASSIIIPFVCGLTFIGTLLYSIDQVGAIGDC